MPASTLHPLPEPTARAIARVFDLYDPPLWLATSAHGERRGGLIATFVVRASIVAAIPRVVLGIARQHHTWGLIEAGGRFALHLLYPGQFDLVWRFGLSSGHQLDKFAGLGATASTPEGQPLIRETLAWLDCQVETCLDSGDRSVYLATVTAGATTGDTEPLGVRGLLAAAPPERRAALNTLYTRDGQIDATAIQAWRAAHSGDLG
jgi:flavin reductase (DIM6/NTAB) family NADH-FMN oxidoreductase RutF